MAVSGTLFVVSTPIGNLDDLTFRAVRVLKEAAVIACEDTRHTKKLLDHYGIKRPLLSYHEHNEHERAAELVSRLQRGESVALVSDAGTPLLSDPGYRIVARARQEGIPVVPLPGASALLAALAASGLPMDAFHFAGFLPPKSAARRKLLESLRGEHATLVFYEAPHRILEALADVEAILGQRDVVVARELTKVHEEFLRGTAAEIRQSLAARGSVKGEITLLVARGGQAGAGSGSVEEAVEALSAAGMPRMEAIKTVARERGLSKREVYRRTHEPEH
ncbi:MAG: 16S rRNA (cytidine(1402)-2'-O)-methyltransferase [Bryobacterales bacterium]|nr:16S rRNA (cytidine(1402)-2'-O)-methyltransferase [Bryobacterales bacterium]